ncbi:MAG: [Bacteroidaceae bacterium]|nr:[FeFe] hydrogenase H-cluster maturation GTPase HydF [Bacteroidaceae bacterium]
MNSTARSNRYHIGIFGRRNAGKSSLINCITGQDISIVSDVAGTTTDTVWKNIELLGIGAAVLADTAGYDDCGELGEKRVERTRQSAGRIDLALLLLEGNPADATLEKEWMQFFSSLNIPVIPLLGKSDLPESDSAKDQWQQLLGAEILSISSKSGMGKEELLERMAQIYKSGDNVNDITHNLVRTGDTVVLVMPQDAQAPQGRLIQPQVQTLRNLLDKHCLALCCAPEELPQMLDTLRTPPSLIITDSQAFPQVEKLAPKESKLTSFSILMARYKGDIDTFRAGAETFRTLPHDARILIAEACSHIPQNEDIGRVKLPRMLRKKFGESITIDIVSGNDFPEDLSPYNLIIHCGACMFTRRHVLTRIRQAKAQNIPITNYGIAIAALTGISDKVSY